MSNNGNNNNNEENNIGLTPDVASLVCHAYRLGARCTIVPAGPTGHAHLNAYHDRVSAEFGSDQIIHIAIPIKDITPANPLPSHIGYISLPNCERAMRAIGRHDWL